MLMRSVRLAKKVSQVNSRTDFISIEGLQQPRQLPESNDMIG